MSFNEDGYAIETCEHQRPMGEYCHDCAIESGVADDDRDDEGPGL